MKKTKNEIAIKASNVNKSFLIPHEKITTTKEHFVSIFKRTTYEKFHVLNDISFEINKGDFFGIIGKNGCGKSTLLKLLANILTPTTGKITVNGKVSPFLELGVGFNPELTGKENVYLNGALLGLTRRQIDERYDQIVEFSELENFMDLKVKNYSSGMFVRLAFSVAIQVDADILLLDEVLAVGDSAFQEKCFSVFEHLKKKGKTIVFVSHSSGLIEKFCNKVLYISNGHCAYVGKPTKALYLYDQANFYEEAERLKKENDNNDAQLKESEKKINDESLENLKKTKAKKSGNQFAEIISVKTYDTNDKELYIFHSGDSFLIKIKVNRKDKNLKILNIGIRIHNLLGVEVLSCNSKLDSFKLGDNNEVSVMFDKVPLRHGEYSISVNVFGDSLMPKYDQLDNIRTIKFTKPHSDMYNGIIISKYKWLK